MHLDPTTAGKALFLALALVAGVLVANVFVRTARESDGAAQAAQSQAVQSMRRSGEAKPTRPAEGDHPPVHAPLDGNTWPEAEIIAAQEECAQVLAPTGVELEILKPIRNGQCGTPAPVLVKHVAGVEISPAAVLGPEANEAHRNHFHLDLAERRRSAFCE